MIRYDREDLKLIFNNFGILARGSSYLFLVPILIILLFGESTIYLYLYIILAIFMRTIGYLLTFKSKANSELRHSIVTISLFWIFFSLVACVPFLAIENMPFADSWFETVSAITTNGMSIVPIQESLAFSTIFWRNFLCWVGGIGLVLLAVFGVLMTYSKFKDLSTAEGHSEKLKSSAKKTAWYLFAIYSIFTLLGILALRIAGMPLFDSVNYAFTTISTGGFDVVNAGLLSYNSLAVLIITLLLTFIGSVSFIAHYRMFSKRSFLEYFKDKSAFVILLLSLFVFVFVSLKYAKFFDFNTFYDILAAQTGGLSVFLPKVYSSYPDLFKTFFVFIMFVGGSMASASGGIKVQRFVLIVKSIWWETKAALLPKNAVFQRKLGEEIVSKEMIRGVFYFVVLFVVFIFIGAIILMSLGYSSIDSFVEVVSAQSGSGFSVGVASASLPVLGKIVLIFNMLIGRLELIPIFAAIGFLFSVKLRG